MPSSGPSSATRSGDPGACLRLASALERKGERDEAYFALLRARGDPDVRARLAKAPAWTHDEATSGSTFWADVAPLVTAPEVAWRTTDLGRNSYSIVAGPFAVVTFEGLYPPQAKIFDPENGKLRKTVPSPGKSWLEGERLVCVGERARDLATGELVGEAVQPPVAKYRLGKFEADVAPGNGR